MHPNRAVCALIVAAGLHAADHKDIRRTASLNPAGSVRLETFKGSIRVGTWDRPEIDIQARIEPDGSSSLDRRRCEQTDVSIAASPDSISIRTRYPDGSCCDWHTGNNPYVSYTIRMPRAARLSIRDRRSDTEISGLAGQLDFDTHRGSATIELAALTGNSEVGTHAGSVELLLPRASRFDLRTDFNKKGSIESDFTIMARLSHHDGEQLQGSVNGGGPVLTLSTHKGRIHLRER